MILQNKIILHFKYWRLDIFKKMNLDNKSIREAVKKKNSVERDNVPFSKNLVGPPLPPLERDTFPRPQNSFQLKTGHVASQDLMA